MYITLQPLGGFDDGCDVADDDDGDDDDDDDDNGGGGSGVRSLKGQDEMGTVNIVKP